VPTEPISAASTPPARGHYSAAILATGTRILEISGALADGPDGSLVGGDDAEEQARQCLRNIDGLLEAAGAKKTDIVRIGVFLTDMADRPAVARAREEYFGDHKPAATLVAVKSLVLPEFKVEIEATVVF
jgi:enamine deaminase RidA (YjgF/YER057c/UK114 family)